MELRNYIHNLTKLDEALASYVAAGAVAKNVLVASVGDEISLGVPTNPTYAQQEFKNWCTKNHVPVPGQYNASYNGNPKLFWLSNLFKDDYGIQLMAPATAVIKKHLPNAHVGANYGPLTVSRFADP